MGYLHNPGNPGNPGKLHNLHNLHIGTLRWVIGMYCALNGALMFVVPYPHPPIPLSIFQMQFYVGGLTLLLGGMALILVAVLSPLPRFVHILAHGFCGLLLLFLAWAFSALSLSVGLVSSSFVMLGVGMLFVPLLEHARQHRPASSDGDLFAFLMGLGAVFSGLIMVIAPYAFVMSSYAPIRPWLPWYGSALLVSGAALSAVQVVPTVPRILFRLAHVCFALAFYGLLFSLATTSAIAIALYGGFGLVVLLLPWLGPRLRQIDPSSLAMRMGLVLAFAAAIPLIAAVALITRHDEQRSIRQALEVQQVLAVVLSENVSSYIALHSAAVSTLASYPDLAELASSEQQHLLQSFSKSYPDTCAFATYDARGRGIARSDDRPPMQSISDYPFFARVQESSQPVLHAANLPATGEPGLLLGAPIYDAEGRFAGVVIESLKAVHLADLLAPAELDPADRVYLVDDQGRLVARRDAEQGEILPSVVALLSGDEPSGAMSYGTSHHQHLVGYAQVSGTDWDVVVERPATIALASSVASRNVAFFILLAAITAAISIGTLAAGGLTATLAALVRAVNQFEAGWADTPLPRSTISEVARLSAAFGALRDRLNTRTAERDQAEIALRMSEERYRTIVETAQEGIWLVNMDSETTFVNRAMAAMLGFSVDEMPGLPLSAFLNEASLHTLLDPGKGQQHITEQHEVSLRRKDGTLVWALMLTNPLRDKEGHPAGMLITVIDITHRRLAEQALRESEARFRNMADSAPVLIWIGELNGTGTFFNQRWSDFTGRTLEQSLGFGWMDSVHPDDIAHCMEVYRAAIAQQEPFHLEYRLRRADGQYRWFINSGVPRQTHDGLSAGYIGSCVDITERKRAEDVLRFLSEASAALSASLDYTTTLSSVARLMVPMLADWCIIDILQEDGSIEQVSVAHVDPEKEDLIRELRRKYPPDPNEPHVIWRVLQTGIAEMAVGRDEEHLARTTCNEEHFQLRCSLGEIGYMTVPLLARGRTLGVVSFVTGQSGRCYQPEDLALAEEIAYRAALAVDNARLYHEAQAAVQARDQFLSIASHELKTPLTALMGYVTLLQRRFVPEGSLSSRDLRALRVIGEQATRLNRLITLLLDLSRIQKGQLGIEPAPLDLVHLTQRVAADMELTLEQHTLTVCAPDEPLWLMGDEVRLEQVLQNLLQNAIKYSPEGGLIEVGVARHGTLARMWVTDEGVGIPKAAMAQLFQRFQRIANPATQHVSGLGLGLYIVKEIVTLHGGEIEVTSTEGLGSTFTVYLPLQVETHTSIAASREA